MLCGQPNEPTLTAASCTTIGNGECRKFDTLKFNVEATAADYVVSWCGRRRIIAGQCLDGDALGDVARVGRPADA